MSSILSRIELPYRINLSADTQAKLYAFAVSCLGDENGGCIGHYDHCGDVSNAAESVLKEIGLSAIQIEETLEENI